jgi:hypothetical protein
MKKTILLGFIISLLGTGSAFAFTDVSEGDDYYDEIDYLFRHEVIEGYDDGSFQSSRAINRAEFLKVLIFSSVGEPDVNEYNGCFIDVGTDWFAPYVCYAYANEWVQGYGGGYFKPGQTVSNAEALKMIFEVYDVEIVDEGGEWFEAYLSKANEMLVIMDSLEFYEAHVSMDRGSVSQLLYNSLIKGKLASEEDRLIEAAIESACLAAFVDDEDLAKQLVLETYDFFGLGTDEEILDALFLQYNGEESFNSAITAGVEACIGELVFEEELEEELEEEEEEVLIDEWSEEVIESITNLSNQWEGTSLMCSVENYEELGAIYDYFRDISYAEYPIIATAMSFAEHEDGEIFYAAFSGCDAIVLDALDIVGVGETLDGYHDLLYFAVTQGHSSLALSLIEEGFDINTLYEDGESLLHLYAASEDADRSEEIETLYDVYDVDLNALNSEGLPAVFAAVNNIVYGAEHLNVLIVNGAEVDAVDSEGKTLLHEAAFLGAIEMINDLLDEGIEVEVQNDYGETALHAAVAGGNLEVVQALLAAGADPEIEDNDGFTPISLASYLGEFEILDELIIQ